MPTDYYDLLGVARGAADDEIKKAYRRLARELHPDTNPDPSAEERFKEITVAYETLRDPQRRQRYDRFGPENGRAAGPGDPFGGGGGLGDLFDAFFGGAGGAAGFGGRGGRGGPGRGGDLEAVMNLRFEEAVFGVQREVTLRAPVVCSSCEGSGARAGSYPSTCSGCQGAGEIRRVRQSILGQMVTASPCPRCGGTGQEITHPCADCGGDGRRTEERSYAVDVPAGIDDGLQLRLSGRGAAGPRGAPPGDLYVHIRTAPHPRFRREGYDLIHVLNISMTQAVLGAHIRFETLDGEEDLVVPPGTQPGRVFELRGRGVPLRPNDGRGRGNLLVQVAVEIPTGISKAEDDLLRQLAELRGEEVAPADAGFLSRIRSAFR